MDNKFVCKIFIRPCAKCHIMFIAKRVYTLYCSHTCCKRSYPEAKKRAKRIRNKRTKCRLAKHYKSEIHQIYDNRGTKEIDHIIPLNHTGVCGLHVPWNLEPLTKQRNFKKSNKWDGTMNNLTYRPWAKK